MLPPKSLTWLTDSLTDVNGEYKVQTTYNTRLALSYSSCIVSSGTVCTGKTIHFVIDLSNTAEPNAFLESAPNLFRVNETVRKIQIL